MSRAFDLQTLMYEIQDELDETPFFKDRQVLVQDYIQLAREFCELAGHNLSESGVCIRCGTNNC